MAESIQAEYLSQLEIDEFLRRALTEDRADHDVTTLTTIDQSLWANATIICHQPGRLAGLAVCLRTFMLIDGRVRIIQQLPDGTELTKEMNVARINGPARAILTGERTALNILTHLSGVATVTAEFARLAEPLGIAISDTRKTIPDLRKLQKLAVLAGGGRNHRLNLAESILIKDNHIALAGGLVEAVRRASESNKNCLKLEVEVDKIKDVPIAAELPVDIIMLDNFKPAEVAKAIEIIAGRKKIEVSGGINRENIKNYLIKGVDYISLGALTHSPPGLDFSLDIEPETRG